MLPGVHGPAQEHDLPVRPWHLSDVWRPHARVPHLSQGHREEDPPLLASKAGELRHTKSIATSECGQLSSVLSMPGVVMSTVTLCCGLSE